ncbi:MATE family efflux transporter [Curvivirga sp.]|uniref:MATE family efflux transporter n=1 Tax=Curvivirga sp. TaxID=2856848 RepID=UPI003B5BD6D0
MSQDNHFLNQVEEGQVTHKTGIWANYIETWKVALPICLSLLGQMAMGTTDVIFIGQLGPTELASASLSSHIYYIYFMISIGIILASNSLISQFRGQENQRMIRRTVRQSIWIAILCSIVFMIPLWFMKEVFIMLGQEESLAITAGRYTDYLMWSFLPAVAFVSLRCFFVGMQQAKMAAVIVWSAVPINAGLDYLLIFGGFGIPALDIEGAGIATTIVSTMIFIAGAITVTFKQPFADYQIFKNFWRPDWEIFTRLFKLGTPMSIRLTLEESVFTVSAILLGWLGIIELAAHTIIMVILGTTYMISLGIADATTSRVGYEFGAKNYIQARQNGWVGFFATLTFTITAALIVIIFSTEISEFILDPSTERADEVLFVAAGVMLIAAFSQIPDGIQLSIAGCLAALNDTKVPMFASIFCYWGLGFSIAWLLAFELDMGVAGFWLGLFIGLCSSAVVNLLRFWYLIRSDARLDHQQQLASNEDSHG